MQTDTDEGQQACDELGIDTIPTLQFWKSGTKLWEHKGIVALENDLGEGANISPCSQCSSVLHEATAYHERIGVPQESALVPSLVVTLKNLLACSTQSSLLQVCCTLGTQPPTM